MGEGAARKKFLREYPDALVDDAATVFVGAGVSMGAGYPSWISLLSEIGEELGVPSKDVVDLAALAQWSIQSNGSKTKIKKVIRDNITPDHDIPETLQILARLPIRHIWTTNYDRLIERSFSEIGRPLDAISTPGDLSIRSRVGAAKLYKMHGTVDNLNEVVISTDDYELFRSRRGAYLPLLSAHLTSTSMLFIGLSFADPNIRHVLSLIRENFTDSPPEHFAIVKPPQLEDYKSEDEYKARLIQHKLWSKDLQRYGLFAVEIEDYDEVPDLMREIERRVAKRRVWISGSWPVGSAGASKQYEISDKLGQAIGKEDYTLVSGTGLVVGSASISGFLSALRDNASWDLDRRLIARPFPQPLDGQRANEAQWTGLRKELARLSGIVIVVGGSKLSGDILIPADGVLEEVNLARAAGAFILPIGATGGVANDLAKSLEGSDIASSGSDAQRPTDAELRHLLSEELSVDETIDFAMKILRRVNK